jgi:hypothetical protein
MELIELQEAYQRALGVLRATPEYAAKEAAGTALEAEYLRIKEERVAARVAAHAAQGQAPMAVPVTTTTEGV